MTARRFMYVGMGMLALVVAYQIGASTVRAQTSGAQAVGLSVVYVSSPNNPIRPYVLLSNGDVYGKDQFGDWTYEGNPLGGTVQQKGQAWGSVKQEYK